jgi:ATP-dependent Clp protease ATP-binding subunit ClpA
VNRLDDDAQRALVFAADEARDLGHDRIGTEHLVLGLVRFGDARIHGLGLSLEGTRAEVRRTVGTGRGERTIGELRFTDAARSALARARAHSGPGGATPGEVLDAVLAEQGSGGARIARAADEGIDDLLGQAADPSSVLARALTSLGVDETRLREAVDRIRGGPAPP